MRKSNMAHTYFISDVHLSDDRPDITACFISFLENEAAGADALYILGDLFEVWIGDDDDSELARHVAQALHRLSEHCPLYFIHGNRDFAIRQGWASKAGLTLLPEQTVIDLYGTATLISHGDELCTRDIAYQKFRKKSRSWWWPRLMLMTPLWYRRRVASRGRVVSQRNQRNLRPEIMDVTPSAVAETMQRFGVQQLIHGHTHRPNIHIETIGPQQQARRIVLGDWYDQGSILCVSEEGVQLQQRPLQRVTSS